MAEQRAPKHLGCTVKATVRRFHSPDADLASFTPSDPEQVGMLVQMMVGPEDGPGEESFDVVVCTPGWLHHWIGEHGPTMGRHYLIIERWDWSSTREYLTRQVELETADSWPALASKVGRIGKWEFEDYVGR